MKSYEDLFDINFSYNGELGRLQHQTQANFQFADKLLQESVITHEEYVEVKTDICNYFKSELEYANKNYMSYIR